MKGLVIESAYIEKILQNEKTWEIRGTNTKIRGRIALIRKGAGTIIGTCDLVDVIGPLPLSTLKESILKHCMDPTDYEAKLPFQKTYAWVLENAMKLNEEMTYRHPKGSVTWVNLPAVFNPTLFPTAQSDLPHGTVHLGRWRKSKLHQ